MFDFFRAFFASFLQVHIFFYPFPAAVRFRYGASAPLHRPVLKGLLAHRRRRDPFFMAFVVIAIQTILQPYPTIADAPLYLCLLSLFPDLLKRTATRLLPLGSPGSVG